MMAKKKPGQQRKAPLQLVVRVSHELDQTLRKAADGLEIDLSALVRMILVEHVGEYIRRGTAARKKVEDALADAADPASDAPPTSAAGSKPVSGPKRSGRPAGYPEGGQENRNMEL